MPTTFVQLGSNGYGGFSTLYKVTPWLIYDAFDALNIWDHPRDKERVLEQDLELEKWSNQEEFIHLRAGSVLELKASLVWVKWRLRSLLLLVFDGI